MVYQTEDVHQDLKRRIVEEDLSPGDFLVERDISLEYNVSRTPVREALRLLVADGLVVLKRGRGYSVRQLTIEDLLEIFIAREAVEGTLASLATARLDAKLRQRILSIKSSLEEVDPTVQPIKAVNLGRQLHDSLAHAAGNQTLLDFYDKLRNVAALTRNLSKKSVDVEVVSRQEHLRIITAVLEERRDAAERNMRLHLRGTCERMVAAYLKGSTTSLGFVEELAEGSLP
ncbi:MAG: GntR family transcriptional regulator [Spirochaetota bacterium]